jgi:chemotaxis protein methyltransferase WspC
MALNVGRARAEARAALEQGDFPRAARIAENLGKAQPNDAEAWFILGVALSETGHANHALGRIERAVALSPDNAEYLAQQGRPLVRAAMIRWCWTQ